MNPSKQFNFRFLGNLDVSKIKENIQKFTPKDWNEVDIRQKRFRVHKNTYSLPIMWDIKSLPYNEVGKKHEYNYNLLEFDLIKNQILELCEKNYGKGKILRALIPKLLANKNIPPHKDNGNSLSSAKRIHIPLITNEKVIFIVEGVSKNLKEGEVWEINNLTFHSVKNNSDYDRVHLIVDYLPED